MIGRRRAALAAFAAATLAAGCALDVGGALARALFVGASPASVRLPTNPLASADTTIIGLALGGLVLEAVVLGWRESFAAWPWGEIAPLARMRCTRLLWASGLMAALGAVITFGTVSVIHGRHALAPDGPPLVPCRSSRRPRR